MTMSRFSVCGVITCMERNLEVALVGRLRAGDAAAFDEIYKLSLIHISEPTRPY